MDTIMQLYNDYINPHMNIETIAPIVFGLALFSALWEWLSTDSSNNKK